MKVVAMINRSAGNESVGDMWTETKVFDSEEPIINIYKWLGPKVNREGMLDEITTNIKLSVSQ